MKQLYVRIECHDCKTVTKRNICEADTEGHGGILKCPDCQSGFVEVEVERGGSLYIDPIGGDISGSPWDGIQESSYPLDHLMVTRNANLIHGGNGGIIDEEGDTNSGRDNNQTMDESNVEGCTDANAEYNNCERELGEDSSMEE